MRQPIAMIAVTMDTKAEEAAYIREYLCRQGVGVVLVNAGCREDVSVPSDIGPDVIAAKAGTCIDDLLATKDKGRIIATLSEGLAILAAEQCSAGAIHGFLSIGGGQGTAIGTYAMQRLPLGFPKVMVSTLASGNMRPFIGVKDIAVFPSVSDMLGMNDILRLTITNAAAALSGMLKAEALESTTRTSDVRLGITAFGTTTAGLMKLRKRLDIPGLDLSFFHANGAGGPTMEDLADSGYFNGLVDWSTHEIVDLVADGLFTPGKGRCDVLARMNIPCLVCPGGIDYVVKGGYDTLPEDWRSRTHIIHNRNITLVRATAQEMIAAADYLSERLNAARGKVVVLLPTEGFCEPNAKGKLFYDPEADNGFSRRLREKLSPRIHCEEVTAHINDDAFVDRAVVWMKELFAL